MLEFIAQRGRIKFIHRDVATVSELEFYLQKWCTNGYRDYRLCDLAFHGEPGFIWVGRRKVGLDQLAEILASRSAGKIIYFGSCGTVDVGKRKLDAFRQDTRARVVCGYTKDVDWMESAAFELLLIEALANYKRVDAAFASLLKNHRSLVTRLGLIHSR